MMVQGEDMKQTQGDLTDEEKLYNQSVKDRFLSTCPNATQQTYGRIFVNSTQTEKDLDVDVYDFDSQQIKHFLRGLQSMTRRTHFHATGGQ